MGLFGFGKKKEKTLEEKAKDSGIEIKNGFSGEGYKMFLVHGSGESKKEAEEHLLENARKDGVVFLSNLTYSTFLRRKVHVVDATAYSPCSGHSCFSD